MGLDSFLYKENYVENWSFNTPDQRYEITIKQGGNPVENIKTQRICYVIEKLAYWRKFNALHSWFVHNCAKGNDDCQRIQVKRNHLEELLMICIKINEDNPQAETLLPTQSGFFFGSTDYNENYYEDVKVTIQVLEKILAEPGDTYYYQASW